MVRPVSTSWDASTVQGEMKCGMPAAYRVCGMFALCADVCRGMSRRSLSVGCRLVFSFAPCGMADSIAGVGRLTCSVVMIYRMS
jgi:hypothetical protein